MADGGGWGSWAERYKPGVAMVLVQLFYSLVDMALKTAYGLGMRPIVFVAYRQGIAAAALLLASLATRGFTLRQMAVGSRAFALLFVASLATATGQYCYFMGLHLASPSMARATTNLAPGLTFAICAVIGLEKVDLRSSRSLAKIIGTVVCLAGAMLMAFFKGPKLLGALLIDDWVVGGMYLMVNAVCFSIWYILQGVFASGANFFMQSWCIAVKGPLYSAIFTPVSAVITVILSTLFLHEELHIGSVLGAITIIFGLYVVLWGKAGDEKSEKLAIHRTDFESNVEQDSIGVKVESETNLSEPLLSENANAETSTRQ
ncbi:unnamed protein product [Alopecurus aequalis]